MTNTIGGATIELAVDSSGVESGLDRVDGAVKRTGRTLDSLRTQGGGALDSIGNGGAAAANRVDAATRNIAGAVERANAALISGKKSGAEYFEELGRSRGADMMKLAPLIAQLRETEAAQARAKAATEAAAIAQQAAAEAARAQAAALREVAQAQAGKDSFVAGLREQIALYGKSTEEVLRYKAAQAGAAEAAGPLILQLQNMRAAHEAIAESTRLEAQAQRQVAQAQANKDGFLSALREQVALHGKSAEEVMRYRAALAGAAGDAEPLIQQIERLKVAENAVAEAARNAERAQRQASQVQANGDAFLGGLREQVALYGKTTEEVLRYKAAQAGVASAAEPQIQKLQQLKVAQEAVTEAARLAAAAQQQAAQVQSNRDTLLAGLREQIALYGKSTEEVLRYRAAQAGATGAAEPMIQELQRLKIAQDAVTEAARLAALAQQQAAQQQAAGTAMVTSLREQIALYGKTTEEVLRYKAAQAGVAGAAEPHIQELQRLKLAEDAVTAAAKAAAEAQRQAATAQTGRDSFVAGLQQQAAAIGKSRSELLELQAAQMGVTAQAAPFIAKLREVEQGLNHAGMSARATAAAMRGVPAQFTDIVVSIQGGQNPLTVLLQQGGQLKDMFGGLGAAAKALGGYVLGLINPYTIAAAAVAVLAVAFIQGRNEVIAYNKALILAGNTATTTSNQLADMARNISKGVGTQGAAAEAVLAMVATGKVTASNLEQFSATAIKAQRALGQSVGDTAAQFADLGKAPVATLLKLDETFHFLTADIYKQVKALELQGRAVEAGTMAQKEWNRTLGDVSGKVTENLGSLQKAWKRVSDGAKEAWDSMLNIGREQTLEQQLVAVQKRLATSAGAASGKLPNGLTAGADTRSAAYAARLAEDLALEASLKNQIALEQAGIAPKEAANKLRESGRAWEQDREKYLTRVQLREQELEKTRIQGAALVAAGSIKQSELDGRLGAIRIKYADTYNLAIDAQIELLKRRSVVEEESAKRSMATLGTDRAAGLATSLLAEFKYADEVAKIDLATLSRKKALLIAELALTASKPNSSKEQAGLSGAIAAIDEQALTRKLQLKNDIAALDIKDTKQAANNLADLADKRATDLQALQGQLQAQKDANALIGLSATEVNKLNQALTEEAAKRLENQADIIGGNEARAAEAATMRSSAVFMRELAAEQARGLDLSAVAKGKKDLEDFLDPSKAQSFGEALRDAFGGSTDAISKMSSSLREFGKISKETETRRGQAADSYLNGLSTEAQYTKDLIAIDKKQAIDKLGNYGDMAGAAASFFDKQSTGYKVLNGVSQAFHAAQLAMNLASIAPAIAAGAAQMFAQSGWGGFAGVTAMIGVMAALGAATSGGGGGPSAKDRQASNGTGTVLGDSSAKSESIAHSLAIMEKNSGLGLAHTISMDSSLKQMVAGIGNLSGLLARSGVTTAGGGAAAGVQTGTTTLGGSLGMAAGTLAGGVGGAALGTYLGMGMAAIGGPLGLAVGSVLGSVLGGVVSKLFNTSTSIKDQGITGKAMSLGNVDELGFIAQAYADVNTKKKAFGISYSSKDSTQTAALSDEMNDQFSMIISSMGQTIRSAADVLGLGGDAFNAKLNTFVVDLGKISLKDLKGEEQQKALETAFSKLGDDMAKFGVAGLQQYQAVGEGYLETLARVANDYMQVTDVLAVLGKSFNTTGLGAVALSESLIAAAGDLEKLTSGTSYFVENFLTEAERMAPITKSVNDAMGKLGQSGVTTIEQFKALVLAQDMNTAAGQAMYAQLIAIAEPFKKAADYVAELAAATGDFAAVAKTASEIASERRDLQSQYDELTMTSIQLREKERAAIAVSNLALYDSVIALKDKKAAEEAATAATQAAAAAASGLLSAVDAASATLQTVVNREKTALAKANEIAAKAMQIRIDSETAAMAKHKTLADTLKSSLAQMNVSGTMEDMGRASAQAQIAAALAIAKAGGPLPVADSLKDALSSVTKDASDKFATYDDYLVDFYRTQNDIAALGKLTDSSLSVEQKTLDLLQAQKDASQVAYEAEVARLDGILETARSQIDVLKGIDTTSLSILQAMTGLASAMAAAQANSSVGALSGINNAYQTTLGRAPEKAGMDYWGGLANSGTSIGDIVSGIKNSPEAQAQALYKSVMGRAGDAAGIDYWTNVLAGGSSIDQVRAAMMGSAEYQKLHSFDVGTNYLPSDMLAQVHEGERIIPAADNRELMARLSSPTSNNDALAAEVRELRRENREMRAMMESHLYAIAKNTLNAADSLEGAANGDMPLTTKKVEETA